MFTLAYSKYMSSVLSYGVNVKFLQQKIESVSATGVAFDLGMLYRTSIKNVNFGISLQNLGSQMKFLNDGYNLPLSVSVGLGYQISGITIGFDVKNYVYEGQTIVGFGTEYMPVTALALRAGYLMSLTARSFTNVQDDSKNSSVLRSQAGTSFGSNDVNGLGAGLGFKLFNIQTDYSFIPYGELGNTQRISFMSRF